MVVAALLLVGAGTTVLTAVNARADTEADLRETVESLSELLAELTIVPTADETGRDIRARPVSYTHLTLPTILLV